MNVKKSILLVAISIFLFVNVSLINAEFGYDNPTLPKLVPEVFQQINQTIINQNITNINQFDQSLNTTDSVLFNSVNVTANVTADSFIGNIFGTFFNWTIQAASQIWLSFDGSLLSFNETKLNESIDQRSSNISINFGANESNTSGAKIPFLLTETGILKIEAISEDEIWEQNGNEIINLNGNILNFSNDIIVNNNLNVGNNATFGFVDGNLTPSLNDTYSLGTSDLRWK
ncbi:hypothetical protein LCGC14_1581760, partial [marine sediment metagenome]